MVKHTAVSTSCKTKIVQLKGGRARKIVPYANLQWKHWQCIWDHWNNIGATHVQYCSNTATIKTPRIRVVCVTALSKLNAWSFVGWSRNNKLQLIVYLYYLYSVVIWSWITYERMLNIFILFSLLMKLLGDWQKLVMHSKPSYSKQHQKKVPNDKEDYNNQCSSRKIFHSEIILSRRNITITEIYIKYLIAPHDH